MPPDSPATALQRTITAAKTILDNIGSLKGQSKEAEARKLMLHKNQAELNEKDRSYKREEEDLNRLLETLTNKESQNLVTARHAARNV